MVRRLVVVASFALFALACGPKPTAQESLAANPTVLDFGKLRTFQTAHAGIALHNHGGAPVENLKLELTVNASQPGASSAFSVLPAPTPLAPLNVPPSESIALVVSFAPTRPGKHSGTLRIRTLDPEDHGIDVQLSGTGGDNGEFVDAGSPDPCCLADAGQGPQEGGSTDAG